MCERVKGLCMRVCMDEIVYERVKGLRMRECKDEIGLWHFSQEE